MKKFTACLAFLLATSTFLCAQQIVKGTVSDTLEKKQLSNSVVALLRKSDSVLLSFVRTGKDGSFLLKSKDTGSVMVMVTHPSYADYIDQLQLTPSSTNDLGRIAMMGKSQLLQEVIVSNNGSIKIKGDTIEYKIDSSMVKAGATVEDLLKKMPGFQVDKNGKITAQGVAVQKVLVDGEEFFSDDPTIVTRNMLADAIDKIQVYDKKSDQAAFTGIDDGEKIKTVDLKLKADRKKGYFGKVELGTDTRKYWNNNAMVNLFQAKRKLAFYGITSNTGKTGLDFWSEAPSYGGASMDMQMTEGGGMYISFDNNDDFNEGSYYGEGLPKGWNAGAHYSNKWSADKIHLNMNYQYKKLNVEASGSTNSKYILPDTLYYINDRGNSFSSKLRNSLNGIYEYQLDSSSSLKVTAQVYTGHSIDFSHSLAESLNEEGGMVNTSDRRVSSEGDNNAIITSMIYRKKFKKMGRTISVNASQNYKENDRSGFLNSSYRFFQPDGSVSSTRTTDQQKINAGIGTAVNTRIAYTEPMSKRAILEFNYGIYNNHGRSSITTLEKMTPGVPKYENIIDSLTNNYSLNVLTNSAGVNYRYSKAKKMTLSVGGNVSRADFTRKNLKMDSTVNYNFVNLFPKANASFTFGQSGNLNFNYYGSTRAPGIEQIQPVRDNTDELNQVIGNPDLKQSFTQRFQLYYNNYKLLSQRNMYGSINYTTEMNAFSYVNYVQPNGQRLSRPINVQGNYSMFGYGGYSIKLKNSGLRLRFFTDMSRYRNTNFINDMKNINISNSISAGPGFSYQKEKKFDLYVSPRITWNVSKSSIRPDVVTKYWNAGGNAEMSFTFPKKFELNTDVEVNIRQRTDAFPDNNNVTRWNARIDKKLLKNDVGIIRLAAFDLLDQNKGFRRDINSNFITERTYDTFRRYFMLSFIWNFSKNGKPTEF